MTPQRYRFLYVGQPSPYAFFESDLQVGEHYEVSEEPPGSITVSVVGADGSRRVVGTIPDATPDQVQGDELTD
jgi:hypothetical protein